MRQKNHIPTMLTYFLMSTQNTCNADNRPFQGLRRHFAGGAKHKLQMATRLNNLLLCQNTLVVRWNFAIMTKDILISLMLDPMRTI